MYQFAMLVILGCVLSGCSILRLFGDDNPIEEYAEEVIKDYTGAEVDITGDSPEE